VRCGFSYYGHVRGQARPRFSKFGVYKVKADKEYEAALGRAYIDAGGQSFGNKPVQVFVDIQRALPKSTPKYIKSQVDVQKFDLDNMLKSVLDALNGLAWEDDKQVVRITAQKLPRVHQELDYIQVTVTDEVGQ
jgi:Holliday junction resolvase RusA-like endonuclease